MRRCPLLAAALALLGALAADGLAAGGGPGPEAWVRLLGHRRPDRRRDAVTALFEAGPGARPVLERAARQGGPAVRAAARRLLRLRRWAIPPRRRDIEALFRGYETRPFLERREVLFRLEKLLDPDALDVLRRAAERDEHPRVRACAALAAGRVLVRLGGGTGALLAALNARGCRHLARGEWRKAHEAFDEMLRLQKGNETALYNKACTFARQGRAADAIAFLKKAVASGFRDRGHIASDPDLESLRSLPAFRDILESLGEKK